MKSCNTIITVVKHIDKTWDLDILYMLDYGRQFFERYKYSSILIEKKEKWIGKTFKKTPKL